MKLAAIAAFVLVGLAVGQTIRPIPDTQVRVVGEIPAEWWTYVALGTSETYVVPAGRDLVVTLIQDNLGDVWANGASVTNQLLPVRSTGIDAGGTRVVFASGTVISAPTTNVRIWGYLEPIR